MMRFNSVVLVLLALLVQNAGASAEHALRIGYVTYDNHLRSEDSAAVSWLSRLPAVTVLVTRLDAEFARIPDCDVLWIHLADTVAYQRCRQGEAKNHALRNFITHKGRLFCTDYASLLPHDLGMESVRPVVRFDTLQDDWLWDKKGVQSYRGHPLLAGLFGGDYIWDARVDQVLPIIGYYGAVWPARSDVIGVEKSYVFLHADRRIVVDVRRQGAHALSIGGLIYFARANNLRANMERFVRNGIGYLAGESSEEPVTIWRQVDGIPREYHQTPSPLHPARTASLRTLGGSGMLLTRTSPHDEFYDLAGRRALIMGRENGGIDEVWVHPFRILRDFEAGVVDGDSVRWLRNCPVDLQVRPEAFVRTYTLPSGQLTEMTVASFQRAGGLVYYESTVPMHLVVRMRTDFRWMWPYDAGALGNLWYGYDSGLNALRVRDSSGSFACAFGADLAPRQYLAGHFGKIAWATGKFTGSTTTENQIAFGAEYALGAGAKGAMSFVFVGTNEGVAAAGSDYTALAERPDVALEEMTGHYRTLLNHSLTVATPDTEFNQLYKWALVGADRFVARTPGLGTGLLAGFSTVNRGWNGGHKISGRPGYGWYFGRDAAWSSFALDGTGDFETVRNQLELYQKFQDASGKIYHELCTSGVVHFDAADATPMYVVLAGHYLRATGDTAFIRKSWPNIKRAMDFLLSTDTDGDGLIENTDVGHGWVEPGGVLFGVHSELYLSVFWSEALRAASEIAFLMGDNIRTADYAGRSLTVRRQINTEFWNPSTGYYSFGKYRNGTYNTERTVFPAVGMMYGLLDEPKARAVLSVLAGNGFTTNWGVRILTGESPSFNPRSYQEGSVWPLMTGWTALAEYTYGNSVQAYGHVLDIMQIKKHWCLGFTQEVMNGAVYRPGGVCPHQCWSETNILHPVVEGLVGWKPDAPHRQASLMPRVPVQWDSVAVGNLRVGSTALAMTMHRDLRKTVYRLERKEGDPCVVEFAPEIPASMEVTSISVNGTPVPFDRTLLHGVFAKPLSITVDRPQTIELRHTGGVGMVPLVQTPAPGDSAGGVRIIATGSQDGTYFVVVEGKQGTSAILPVMVFDDALPTVEGATLRKGAKPGTAELLVSFAPGQSPFQQTIIRMQLR
jgi:glycogen debranching enzyme